MKKQQYFNNIAGAVLLGVVLFGFFVFMSKPKQRVMVSVPQPVAPPVVVVPPQMVVQPPVPEPTKIEIPVKPTPPPEPVKPKIVPPTPKPKPSPEVVAIKPKPPVEVIKLKPPVQIVKPKVPLETPKPKATAEAPKPKPKFVFRFPFFKPKPKPSPKPSETPKPKAPEEVEIVTPPTPKKPPIVPEKGRIVLVIDDWGYTLENIPIVERFPHPITAAIIPNLPHSRDAANTLHARGFEIILHLPMQPHGNNNLEKNTITTSMDDTTIKDILNRDLDNVAYAKGVNNHMGSMATEDERVMEIVLGELKKRHLYFLDSFVTPKSVCVSVAHKLSLPVAQRDVFLDNEEDPAYIRQQVEKLKGVADSKGWAIGIGHDRKNTLEVLSVMIPELEKEGYRFITLSELIS